MHIPRQQRSRSGFCKHLACNLEAVLSGWEHVVITSGPAYNEFGYKDHFSYSEQFLLHPLSRCKGGPV